MKRTKIISVFPLLAPALIACGVDGDPPTEQGSALHWTQLPINYSISSTVPEAYRAEIEAAFVAWETATNTKIFHFSGVVDLNESELNNEYHLFKNVVFALPGDDFPGSGEDVLARTYLHGASAIRDADIYIFNLHKNFENGRTSTGDIYSLTKVMEHEIGHMLFGPEHSPTPDSILFATIYPQGDPRESSGPTPKDVDHFFEVYGDML